MLASGSIRHRSQIFICAYNFETAYSNVIRGIHMCDKYFMNNLFYSNTFSVLKHFNDITSNNFTISTGHIFALVPDKVC